jgi:hypothetical protein
MLLWSVVIDVTGGWYLALGGLRLSSRTPIRPLLAALVAVALHIAVAGLADTLEAGRRVMTAGDRVLPRFRRVAARAVPWLAVAFAVGTAAAGIIYGSRTAGGSDSYGYVSEADLWLRGALVTPVPAAAEVPWPNAIWTLSPLGYRPTLDGRAIVPTYAPGLSLLMAGAKLIGGQRAMFWIAPLAGGVLVLVTFGIGARLGSRNAGLAGAYLVATSPTLMASSCAAMSDAPAAAAWAVATWLVLDGGPGVAALAGLVASVAILIRPNIVLIAAALAVWLVWTDRQRGGGLRFVRLGAFALCALPGCVAVALINRELYGAATSSGYGDLNSIFSLSRIPANAVRYATWLAATQTPLAFAGLLAALWPSRLIWPAPGANSRALLLSFVVFAVAVSYFGYQPFDAWWYLRFLLPAWPAVFLGLGILLTRPLNHLRPSMAALLILGVAALGVHTHEIGVRQSIYTTGAGEHKYDAAALLARDHTEPGSVLFSMQHSGSARYYAGLKTLRFDNVPPEWLDRAIDWCAEHKAHPYALLDEWEIDAFRKRFGGTSARGALPGAPVFVYKAATTVYLYDLLAPDAVDVHPELIASVALPPGATPPAPPPVLSFVR